MTVSLDDPMVRSARHWLSDALAGWAEGDYAKAATLAPIAIEHFAKAVLFERNPVLLAPLHSNHERTFLALATGADLAEPGLRTIGLSDALSRVSSIYASALPFDEKRKRRIIECRGGAIHVGRHDPETSQHVLTDVLALFRWLAELAEVRETFLFGSQSPTAERLLDARRTSKQRSVDQRIAAAQLRIGRLVETVGADLIEETIAQKEATIEDQLPRLINYVSIGSKRACPACHHIGMILGDLDTDADVEVDWNPDGPIYNVAVDYYLIPDSFYCHVCGLTLNDPEELAFTSLPSEKFELADDEITDELLNYAEAQNDWLREQHEAASEYIPDDV